jgi:hypothetical protein
MSYFGPPPDLYGMTQTKPQKPNDQRSDSKNPNNPAHDKDHGNRGKQKNPNQGGNKKK